MVNNTNDVNYNYNINYIKNHYEKTNNLSNYFNHFYIFFL